MNLSGSVPAKLLNKLLPGRLMALDRRRLTYDKSLQIDKVKRHSFLASVEDYDGDYEEEAKEIDSSLASLVAFDLLPLKSKVETVSPLVLSTIGREPGKSIGWGKSEIIVHASLEEVFAFLWHFSSRARTKEGDLEKTIVEEKSLHHVIAYAC